MKYTNIIEKLLCIVNLVKNNWIYLVFLGIIAFFLVIVIAKKISRKHFFMVVFVSYIGVLGYTIFSHLNELVVVFNSLVDQFFTNLYFPSVYVYLFVLVMIDIVSIVSFFRVSESNTYKWINGVFFFMIQFVFVLILDLLSKNEIDIFSKVSLFSNKDLVMMLEFSINLFLVWLGILVFIYITNVITLRVELSRKANVDLSDNDKINDMGQLVSDISIDAHEEAQPVVANSSVMNTPVMNTPVMNTNEVKEFVPSVSYMSDNVVNSSLVDTNYTVTNYLDSIPVSPVSVVSDVSDDIDYSMIQNSSLNQTIRLNDLVPTKSDIIIPTPVVSEDIVEQDNSHNISEEVSQDDTSSYTLNDYRLFNKILKEIKEHNQSNTVTIDKDLEYRLITKYSDETYRMFKTMLKIYSH